MEKNDKMVVLPDTLDSTMGHINGLMKSFNLPREILASDEEIYYAWKELPREIMRIPNELRNELIVRMCVATSVGLFDGAINYIWNAVILTLRKKILNFGLALVAQTLSKKFDESDLEDIRDSELLDLCYKLELLSEEGYFFLNQCREIRNKFSAAHPSVARIDDRELITFISRCCKFGITDDYALQGVKVSDFINAIKGRKFDDEELTIWKQKLEETFAAQRQLLLPSLMGIYCDPESSEMARLNALRMCIAMKDYLDEKIKSSMIEQYNKYFTKGESERYTAGKIFFEKLGLLNLLSEAEQHSIIKSACKSLLTAHLEYNNFYNEPPFAERLRDLTSSMKTPETVQGEFVYTVLMCYVGNYYGVSNAAISYYEEMIKNFSPREINFLLHLMEEKSLFTDKIQNNGNCKIRYKMALGLIDEDSMNAKQLSEYTTLKLKLSKN